MSLAILQEKLQYFDEDKYQIADTNILLREKNQSGKVSLTCQLDKETLVILDPEKNVLPYLNEKSGSRKCPDKFLFQMDEEGCWNLHVMEFKKTINTDTLENSKLQFTMGIYNARAIAGFLNITIGNIYVYSAYRKDSLADKALILLRTANLSEKDRNIISEWTKSQCTLEIDSNKVTYIHSKIQLDEAGVGACSLYK